MFIDPTDCTHSRWSRSGICQDCGNYLSYRDQGLQASKFRDLPNNAAEERANHNRAELEDFKILPASDPAPWERTLYTLPATAAEYDAFFQERGWSLKEV